MLAAYQMVSVWPAPDHITKCAVEDFWLAEHAMPPEAIATRSQELVIVAYHPCGAVAAVSTAVPVYVPQLELTCFYYRTYVGRVHRVIGVRSTQLAWRVLAESYRVLNARYQNGIDPSVKGLYLEIENRSLMRLRNETIWKDFGANAVFIGRNPDGQHCRVWYFEGTRIP